MALLCFCAAPRWIRTRSTTTKDQPVPPSPPPPARRPGPLTLNPVTPIPNGTPLEPLSPPSASIPSTIAVEPYELVVEDSDSDDELESTAQSRSAGKLQLVTSHLRRHLSQDSLPGRKARTSVGTSQHEIERRAELKRLMHKRIQEELRNEESEAVLQSDISSTHRDSDSPAVDSFPCGGPRDNIEFSVIDSKRNTLTLRGSSPRSHASISQPRIASNDSSGSTERRSSCPEGHSRVDRHAGQQSFHIPSSPNLLPRRYSSSSLGSWRLSISPDRLDEFVGRAEESHITRENGVLERAATPPVPEARPRTPRNQSPGLAHSLPRSHSSPACHGSPANTRPHTMEQSPLTMWLRSQGLGPRHPLFGEFDQDDEQDSSVQQAEVVYLRRWSSVQNSALPETDTQRHGLVHLHDMDIHQQLATQTLNSLEGSAAPSESQRKSRSGGSGGQQSRFDALIRQADFANRNLAVHIPRVSTANQPDDTAVNSSSVYPSAATSVYDSPGTSAWILPNSMFNQEYIPALPLLDFHGSDNPRNPQSPVSSRQGPLQVAGENLPNKADALDTSTGTPVTSRPILDTPSVPQVATLADTVEKSIGYFQVGNGAPALVIQRFRQDVDSPPQSEPNKSSFLARLHLSIPRRIKLGSRSFDSPEEPRESPHVEYPGTGRTSPSRPAHPAVLVSDVSREQKVHGDGSAGTRYSRPERRSRFPVKPQPSGNHSRQSSAPISLYPVQRDTAETFRMTSTTRPAPPLDNSVSTQILVNGKVLSKRPSPPPEGPQLLPSKLSKSVKSRLGTLVPARPFPTRNFSNPSWRGQKGRDYAIRSAGFPDLQASTDGHGHPQRRAMGQDTKESTASRQLSCPLPLQNMGAHGSSIALGPRMAAVLHTDGALDVAPRSQSTSTLALATPINPTSNANHRKESTATTSKYVTPLSSMYPSNNSSFHSYPQSTPESRSMPVVSDVLAEILNESNDLVSVKSDTALFKKLRPSLIPHLDSAPVALTRFKTWSGMSRTRPALDMESLKSHADKRKAIYVV